MTLIALDLDGTLEDSRADMVASAHRVRAAFQLPRRGDDAVRPWVNQGMETLYRNCFDDYLSAGEESERLAEVRLAYEADYTTNVANETRLYLGIDPALTELSSLGRLVVVTNKPEKISVRLLEELKVADRFSAVVGGDSCAESKPSPLMLQEAARRAGIDPSANRAVMIGDTAADIKMGRAFGAATIWCAWGYAASPGETPDFTARTPRDLAVTVRSYLTGPRFSALS